MPLAVGDAITWISKTGSCIGTTTILDADGRGSVTVDGYTFRFRVYKELLTPEPLTTSGANPHLRVGVIKQDADQTLYCLCFDDLPMPLGFGRHVGGDKSGWQAGSTFEVVDSTQFVVSWYPTSVRLLTGSAPVVSGYADIVPNYQTPDGPASAVWQPAYPYHDLEVDGEGVPQGGNTDLGMFVTDADGYLQYRHADGTTEPIIFPHGLGALGHRLADGWTSGPTPSRYLTSAEVWYKQQSAEVAQNGAVVLNIAAVTLNIVGPANATYRVFWEEGVIRATGSLDGAGEATITGLLVGDYAVDLHNATEPDKWLPRQAVSCPANAGEYTITFPTSWNTVAAGKVAGRVYGSGATPAAGVVIYDILGTIPGPTLDVLDTTDGSGDFEFDQDALGAYGALINDSRGACLGAGLAVGGKGIYWDPCLGGRCSVSAGWANEGLFYWGRAGTRSNLLPHARAAYVMNPDTGTKYYLRPTATGNGMTTDPMPLWLMSGWSYPAGQIWYKVYDADDTYMTRVNGGSIGLPTNGLGFFTPPNYTGGTPQYRWGFATGGIFTAVIGGNYGGPVVEYRPLELTAGVLREPERVGLETGDWDTPLDHYAHSATVQTEADGAGLTYERALTADSWECAYCGGPVAGALALGLGYTRGYCQQCADYGVTADNRSHFAHQTIPALSDWSDTTARQASSGSYSKRLVEGWPRHCEYQENDGYVVEDWEGLGIPRWVATHIVLGTFSSNVFTDGESIADAEARVAETIGPVMLKLEVLQEFISGTGEDTTVTVTATRADNGQSAVLTGTLPNNAQVGDLVFLRQGPHHVYPGSPCRWFTDVTNMTCDDNTASVRCVNDGPSWRSSTGVEVKHQTYTPYACDVRFGEAGLCCFHQIPNFLYVFYGLESDPGLKHIYNAPPDWWWANGQSRYQSHYALPRTDTTEDDASPSGYVDTNGRMRLYFIRGGALLRSTSQNWGLSWEEAAVATAITSADQAFQWPSADRTMTRSIRVDGGSLIYSYSSDHLGTLQGSSTVTTGVDSAQVCGYDGTDGYVYVYCFKSGVLYCYKMTANGAWAEA